MNQFFKSSYQVGNVLISPNLVLAPMAGVTDTTFRLMIRRIGGLGLCMTEFLSSEGLARGGTKTRTYEMMRHDPEERPLAIQLFGHDPEMMARAAIMAEEEGATLVDINCGCPARKVVKGGGGSNLLRELPQLEKILRAVKKVIAIPLTLKIRAGWDAGSINCVEVAKMAEDCGVQALTLHGRTRVQGYEGLADWSLVAALKRAVSIPIIGSGDIRDWQNAFKRLEETGCDGVMVGRGVMGNPWIFMQAHAVMNGEKPVEPALEDKRAFVLEYACLMLERIGHELIVLGKVKQLCGQFTRGLPGGSRFRQDVYHSHTLDEAYDRIDAYFDQVIEWQRAGWPIADEVGDEDVPSLSCESAA